MREQTQATITARAPAVARDTADAARVGICVADSSMRQGSRLEGGKGKGTRWEEVVQEEQCQEVQ